MDLVSALQLVLCMAWCIFLSAVFVLLFIHAGVQSFSAVASLPVSLRSLQWLNHFLLLLQVLLLGPLQQRLHLLLQLLKPLKLWTVSTALTPVTKGDTSALTTKSSSLSWNMQSKLEKLPVKKNFNTNIGTAVVLAFFSNLTSLKEVCRYSLHCMLGERLEA